MHQFDAGSFPSPHLNGRIWARGEGKYLYGCAGVGSQSLGSIQTAVYTSPYHLLRNHCNWGINRNMVEIGRDAWRTAAFCWRRMPQVR